MPYCCVPGCGNKSTDPCCSNLTFHRLPITNKDLLNTWIHNLNLNEEHLPDHYRVCSAHFDSNSFRQSAWASKRCIQPGTAPIQFRHSHIYQNEANPFSYHTNLAYDVLKTSNLENTERKRAIYFIIIII